jgi:hypothetical protein
MGTLLSPDERFNGPSRNELDNLFLKILGYNREEVILCPISLFVCFGKCSYYDTFC